MFLSNAKSEKHTSSVTCVAIQAIVVIVRALSIFLVVSDSGFLNRFISTATRTIFCPGAMDQQITACRQANARCVLSVLRIYEDHNLARASSRASIGTPS